MKKATIISCISIMLTLCIIFNIFAIESLTTSNNSWTSKIDSSIYDHESNSDGKRLIAVFRESVSDEVISKTLKQEYGYDTYIYENADAFQKNIVPKISSQVESEFGSTKAYEIAKKGELSLVEKALNKEYDEYILAKRSVTANKYLAKNAKFINAHSIDNCDILYSGTYTSTFLMYATDEEIVTLAKDSSVKRILSGTNGAVIPQLDLVNSQVDTDNISGTKSPSFNGGDGYTGEGVKIGIIEACEKNALGIPYLSHYNPAWPHLSPIDGTRLFYVDNIREDGFKIPDGAGTHPSAITSVIVGQPVTVDGITYSGIVPDATVYQTGALTESDIPKAFALLASQGVSVINASLVAEEATYGFYTWLDMEIDQLIKSTGITFVAVAGNTGLAVPSPGLAYNAITVGNAKTKEIGGSPLTAPYSIHTTISGDGGSSYLELDNHTNKPDICAPGYNVFCVQDSNYINPLGFTGTSISAPIVTGIVAQIHQELTVRLNPTRTKALVLAGATEMTKVSGDTAENGAYGIYEKSGVGFVNAINSLSVTDMLSYSSAIFNTGATSAPSPRTLGRFYLNAGETVRILMTFDKPEAELIISTDVYGNNVDLFLYNYSTDELVASCTQTKNNVEIIEYTATTSGYYYSAVELVDYIQADSQCYLNVAVVWRVLE